MRGGFKRSVVNCLLVPVPRYLERSLAQRCPGMGVDLRELWLDADLEWLDVCDDAMFGADNG